MEYKYVIIFHRSRYEKDGEYVEYKGFKTGDPFFSKVHEMFKVGEKGVTGLGEEEDNLWKGKAYVVIFDTPVTARKAAEEVKRKWPRHSIILASDIRDRKTYVTITK